jgi:hypothetical protein
LGRFCPMAWRGQLDPEANAAHDRPRASSQCAQRTWAHSHRDRSHGSGVATMGTSAAPSPVGLHGELEGGSGVAPGKAVGDEAHR